MEGRNEGLHRYISPNVVYQCGFWHDIASEVGICMNFSNISCNTPREYESVKRLYVPVMRMWITFYSQ